MKNIYGITFEELENYFIEKNDKKFKATQVFDWVYKKRKGEFNMNMDAIRAEYQEEFLMSVVECATEEMKRRRKAF